AVDGDGAGVGAGQSERGPGRVGEQAAVGHAVGDEGAAVDDGPAAVTVQSGEADGAAAVLGHFAGSGDGIADREGARAVEDQAAVVGDVTRTEAAVGVVVADLQGAGADGDDVEVVRGAV